MWTRIISLHTHHESQPLMYSQNESLRGNQEKSNLTGGHAPPHPQAWRVGFHPLPQRLILCFKDSDWALDIVYGEWGKGSAAEKSKTKQNTHTKNKFLSNNLILHKKFSR